MIESQTPSGRIARKKIVWHVKVQINLQIVEKTILGIQFNAKPVKQKGKQECTEANRAGIYFKDRESI